MKKLIFTVYMLILFIFSATAHPNHHEVRPDDKVVVIVRKVDTATVLRKKEQAIRHRRLHRRDVRVERRIHRAHRRHAHRHH